VNDVRGVLLDVDGVLHDGRAPIAGAREAVAELRERTDGLAFLTNTTTRSRGGILGQLRDFGFDVADEELVTPAGIAVAACHDRGLQRVALLVSDALREDLGDLEDVALDARPQAVLLADTGHGFDVPTLNGAFRALMDGAQLIALGHNRYYARPEGLIMDVGAWSAALEYAADTEALVVGKPSEAFFAAALDAIGVPAEQALMVGDDVEADVGGALEAGMRGVLVRTGKYRPELVESSGWRPTATVDSIADVPELLA
jgi:HAD superfamily hydrolase (TIGR01458 family)